jgi:hypothetical protein
MMSPNPPAVPSLAEQSIPTPSTDSTQLRVSVFVLFLCLRRHHESKRRNHSEAEGAIHAVLCRSDASAVGFLCCLVRDFHSGYCSRAPLGLYARCRGWTCDDDHRLPALHSGQLIGSIRYVPRCAVRPRCRNHIVQVVTNPLISMLGKPHTAHRRLTFAQAFNSLGMTIFPYVGSISIPGSLASVRPRCLTPSL